MPSRIKEDNIKTISNINTSIPMLHNSEELCLTRSPTTEPMFKQLICIKERHHLVFNN